MLYFLSSTIIELGLDVSWWFLKKGTYLLYNGVYYLINYSNTEETIEEDITSSVIIIDNEELIDDIKEIKKILSASKSSNLD